MYDHFVGEVVETSGTAVVLLCGGVGYQLRSPISTTARLAAGTQARLYSILHVVDGSPTLLGFSSKKERELARRILAVSGVGPSIALAILSTYDPPTFARMVVDDDVTGLRLIKGVGNKTAERLCLELRDRVSQLDLGVAASPTAPGPDRRSAEATDAIAALVTLGYAERDATSRVSKVLERDGNGTTEALIKAVLRG